MMPSGNALFFYLPANSNHITYTSELTVKQVWIYAEDPRKIWRAPPCGSILHPLQITQHIKTILMMLSRFDPEATRIARATGDTRTSVVP